MSENDRKLQVLAKIAEHFNKECITWALGASTLLYLKNVTDAFHDLDVLIIESDVDKAETILDCLGKRQEESPNAKYRTRHFLEYVIDGVDVDVMAGFVIVANGTELDASLRKEQIVEFTELYSQKIPLMSLLQWKIYYEWMGRAEKVHMIENALNLGKELIENLDRLHTTELGEERIRRNLCLEEPVMEFCRRIVKEASYAERRGKNYYVTKDGCVLTINASSFTVITAYKIKGKDER